MTLYFAGGESEMGDTWFEEFDNILFSYHTGKREIDKNEYVFNKKLFIDSGAFSAWTKGVWIDVDLYLEWLNNRLDGITLCGQLDVIPGSIRNGATNKQIEDAARDTWTNYLYMRDRIRHPEKLLYTHHVLEPFSYLEQALEWNDNKGNQIPYIALGGLVGKNNDLKKTYLDKCFDIIQKSSNPNIKVHVFGVTVFDLLESYPIASADSTSWIMVGANGGILTDAGVIKCSERMSGQSGHYKHLTKQQQDDFEKTISEYGFTLDELSQSREKRILHNARYMQKKADNYTYKPKLKKRGLF